MSVTEWQEKFSSIVKQTETNLDRVKQRLSSAQLNSSLPLSTDILNKFMAPDQMSRTVSSFPMPTQGNFNSSMALQHLNSSEGHVSTLMAPLPLSITEKAVEAKYIPLHESASVIALLQDKIEEQNTAIESCLKYIKKNEQEKEMFKTDLRLIREELEKTRSASVYKEPDFGMEQNIDKLKQDVKAEARLMDQKYNYLKNHVEEVTTALERRHSSLSEAVVDMQKHSRGDAESLHIKIDTLEKKISKVENRLLQLSTSDPKPSQLRGDNFVIREPWPVARHQNFRSKNSVSFFDDNQAQWSLRMGNNENHFDEIKNSFRDLQRKLASLEVDIVSDSELSSPVHRRSPRRVKPIVTKSIPTPSTSDIDFSTATDLVTFSQNIEGKSNGSFSFDPNLTLASDLSSEDDLTLDDL